MRTAKGGKSKKAIAAALLAAQLLSPSVGNATQAAQSDLASTAATVKDRDYSAIAVAYCRDVVSKRIAACLYIQLACQEHLDDLAAQHSADAPWVYDAKKGERVCRYVERFPHVKNDWAIEAGQSRLLHLQPWQIFATCRLFGMVSRASGIRRFREFYAEIPRKNGKTTLVAAWAHYLAFQDRKTAAEVYIGASKMEQALIAFDDAAAQLQDSGAARAGGLVVSKRQIMRPSSRSRIRAVAKRPGDGGSPHAAVLDELHEHERSDLRDSMVQGMGADRDPMLIQITTAGYDVHGVCYEVRSRAVRVLTKVTANARLFALIYTIDEADDPLAPGAYIKANPNLGVSVKAEDLEEERLLAQNEPATAFAYRTKKLNVWGQSRRTFFNVNAWMTRCFDPELATDPKTGKRQYRNPGIPAKFAGKPCVEGQDLSARIDLASRVKIFVTEEGKSDGRQAGRHYYVFGNHYAPQMTVRNGQNNETLAQWADTGWLKEHDGYEIQLPEIQAEILADTKLYKFKALAFDPAFARQMQQELIRELGEGLVWDINQNARELSDGMKEFQAAIVAGRVHHNGDPVLTFAIGNVVSRPDPNENEFPRKEKPENKIDPVSALLNGMNRVMAAPEITTFKYRGLRSV